MIGLACLELAVAAGPHPRRRQAASILVVDDDPVTAQALAEVLVRAGHDVTMAGDGLEAIRCLGQSGFDLVVTDIVMPRMDGLELIQHLRRELPSLPIVAVSGGSSVDPSIFLRLASHFGVKATITKPFGAAVLLETLRTLLGDVAES